MAPGSKASSVEKAMPWRMVPGHAVDRSKACRRLAVPRTGGRRQAARWLVAAGTCLLALPLSAGEVVKLQPGLYEVSIRLDLPNMADAAAKKLTTLCVSAADNNGNQGLKPLSDNNPLARCPVANVAQQEAQLTFEIVCPGGNAAVASARYQLTANTFTGRISMKLGGKNMTMTETQAGRRTGECPS